MATVDIENVKRELKVWQRAFRTEHGRDITKEDIKANPAIDAKYAKYRQMTKGSGSKRSPPVASTSTATNSQSRNDGPPSTPRPRRAPTKSKPTASILHKSLPETSATLPVTSNPFSPTKKRIELIESPVKPRAMKNPFLASPEPSKLPGSESRSGNIFTPVSSANIFGSSPNKQTLPPSSTPSAATSSTAYDANSPRKFRDLLSSATTAFRDTPRTKARKRLRGEDVPETPGDKRRRVTRLLRDVTLDDAQDDEQDLDDDDEGIELTPAKPGTGKVAAFRPTFDDLKLNASAPARKTSLLRHGNTKDSVSSASASSRIVKPSLGDGKDVGRSHSLRRIFSKGLAASSLSEASWSGNTDDSDVSNSVPNSKEQAKRQRWNAEDDRDPSTGPSPQRASHPTLANTFGLRPPSPTSTGADSKGKSNRWGDRKKTKMQLISEDQQDDGDDIIEEDETIKELEWKSWGTLKTIGATVTTPQGDGLEHDQNSSTGLEGDNVMLLYRAKAIQPQLGPLPEEDVEVDLPDEMKKVLVIDSPKKKDDIAQRIVQRALSGQGPVNNKGEDVWVAGEINLDDDELDWESEPEGWTNTVEM